MSIDCAKQIAKQLMALNMNILCWNRAHIEKSFNINGKTKEGALTIRQFHVLMFIKSANIHTLSEIAKWFSISKSSMSIMLSKLEKLGYLTRKQEADMDGRKVFFHLTTKGKEAVAEAEEMALDTIAACFSQFDAQTQARCLAHLEEFNQMMTAGGKQE